MRYFVKVRFKITNHWNQRAESKLVTASRVYMCPSLKARKAIMDHFGVAATISKRNWLPTHFGQLKSFGSEYWGAIEPNGIPSEILDKHPGIFRVVKRNRNSGVPNIDNMQLEKA